MTKLDELCERLQPPHLLDDDGEFELFFTPRYAQELIREIQVLQTERELYQRLMDEAIENCETCRGMVACARCQTFSDTLKGKVK